MIIDFKKTKVVETAFLIVVLAYFFISAFYFLGKVSGAGDESLFMDDLAFVKEKGWTVAIAKNISVPYLILAYPLSFFMENHLALRLVNVLLLALLFFYFYKQKRKFTFPFYMYLLFFVSTVGYFFMGTNDTLFFVGLILFINEVSNLQTDGKWNGALAFSALLVAFFTRELVFVYFPVILLCFYAIYIKRGFSKVKYWYPLGIFCLMVLLNIPSLTSKGKFSYDLKSPPSTTTATWAQRQYLAQLMVNKGELPNYKHPSWEQTDAYLEKYGADSLPKGILEGLFFDLKLTVVEFFKDFYYSVFFGFRQLGLILLVPLFFMIKNVFSSRKLEMTQLLPLSLWIMIAVFSLIIISFVELRWLAPVFILNIAYYNILQKDKKIPEIVVLLNYILLIAFSFYGCMNLSKKLIAIL